ncbi:MAG: hypothetical protein KatS3mg009_1075 [Acidimicrobiia bacterium]|nr:MAG: hypothetical protein KatS3mg009_1075 [Acidimicrobiia bacterium]
METTADVPPPRLAPPPLRREAARTRELRAAKRRATGLLLAAAAAFVVVAATTADDGWTGYLRAGLEAAMVGGLADWFAVTALFRHPLGLPIPHTAVIRERKDSFGETLGEFVQENFLSADAIAERVRSSYAVARAADWLARPVNARVLAGHVAGVAVGLADALRDEDVNEAVDTEIRRAVERVEVAPLAGRLLRFATESGRHQELLDSMLRGAQRFLEDNREALRERFGRQSPWWLPMAVEDRIFERLVEGVTVLLQSVNDDPRHELRAHFDARVAELADRLEHDPALRERGEQLKRELLEHPQLRAWSASLWADAKRTLRAQASDPASPLRDRLAGAFATAGERLRADAVLAGKAEDLVDRAVRAVVERFSDELAALVSGTIARWDADETSHRLELLLGRDLQFIRINGTIVGGLAGVAIHGVGRLL